MDTSRNSQTAVDLTENRLLKNSALQSAALMSMLSTYQHSALVNTKSTLLETESTCIGQARSVGTKSVIPKVRNPIVCFLGPLVDSLSYSADIVDRNSKFSKRPKVPCEKKLLAKPLGRNLAEKKHQKTDRATKEKKCEKESEKIENFSKDICDTTECNFRVPDYSLETDFQPEVSEFQTFLPPEKDQCILQSLAPTYRRALLLLNATSAWLFQSPNFRNPGDAVRLNSKKIVKSLLVDDPEFVQKSLCIQRAASLRPTRAIATSSKVSMATASWRRRNRFVESSRR